MIPEAVQFEALWAMHPAELHTIKTGKTRRWQQAYGRDYRYSGTVNKTLPTPQSLEPLLTWAKDQIDPRLNGLLLNWYDASLGHCIGRHSDSVSDLVRGAQILTISFGEERIFRIRPNGRKVDKLKKLDFPAKNGMVFVMSFETNLAFTHEVPAFKKSTGRRISVTLRAFATVANSLNRLH